MPEITIEFSGARQTGPDDRTAGSVLMSNVSLD